MKYKLDRQIGFKKYNDDWRVYPEIIWKIKYSLFSELRTQLLTRLSFPYVFYNNQL